ncbi:acetylornithine transaminase [Okibacterium endophyticum]
MNEWIQKAGDDMMPVFGTPKAMLVAGDGCWVTDVDGKRYLDFLGGIAVNVLGHGHPAVVEAISRQAASLIHVSNFFVSAPQLELAARLKRIAGAGDDGRVFFCNSGTEANEAAFKLARLHSDGTRQRILALDGAFHGRTMGALALTAKAAYRDPFAPLPAGVEHISPTLEALEAAIDDTVAAVVVEPIQGEAGVVPLPDGFLARARELTSAHGALLVIDEIQTGVGRTGDWFRYQRAEIVPDAVTLAKGLGGGVPIGAMVTFGAASKLFGAGQHGTTFGGNPLATAAANAVLAEIERAGLVENARIRGDQIRRSVEGIGSHLVSGTRGAGLLIGIALSAPVASRIVTAAQDLGLIVNAPNDTTIRLAPPLIVGDAEVAEFDRIFRRALETIESGADLLAPSTPSVR